MQGKRVLITGGAGFIGSSLANHLVDRNEVLVVDDGSLGTPANVSDSVSVIERSVVDSTLPTDVDVVFHLAALSSYAMHEADPQRGVRVNVEGFVNTVEQARRDGCDVIVYASTSSVYGDRAEPTAESLEVGASTGYEASKLSRERYGEYFHDRYGMELTGLRLFSVYQGYHGGESHKDEYANVIAQFADDVANGRSPELYGTGEQTRDFVHVEDVVRAFELAADYRFNGVFNVGAGERHSFNRIVEVLNELLGRSVEPTYVENPIPEHVYVHDTCADCNAFRKATGWSPEIDLEDGLRRVCAPYAPDRLEIA
ncbi:NAD-dependent epimerase/dehydratase family protein [Natrarchaeobius halalkaliphilus]|uniref:NAD-dependent epimerase/dehydratase family protein n=1 Tax=Natrarchaeobius halalkaliphilus TaxID=1679091 RepID=A0A3N6LSR8_9EURY|nr:NAD-dependent epimerase/dehydratase family protein [Natrarchaeobius halalkaliphilus]RQG93018.1 NAD-dependent epimerase/dehydratase family protein [Natrarchaeobius halalkaliphilus]